jgi:hypothetical protein
MQWKIPASQTPKKLYMKTVLITSFDVGDLFSANSPHKTKQSAGLNI